MNKQSTTSQADRQIKFRAWDGKKMIYPDGHKYVLRFDGTIGKFDEIIKQYHTEEWKLMQFTGLLDKNGKEIYEGDLLRIKFKTQYYDLEAIYEVVHRGFTTQFVIRSVVSPSEVYTDIHLEAGKDFEWYAGRRLEITSRQINGRQSSEDIEVCGDIHANSNLLQG